MRILFALTALATIGVVAVILLTAGWPGMAEAQQNEIRIVAHRVETDFPKDVKFYVEVAGPDDIAEVRVYMKTIGQTARSAYRQVEFEPGTNVSGEAELLTSGNNYVPPGTRLAYHFEVTDTTGRTLRTEDEVFVYLDTRFEWFTVSEGIITVYYNSPLVKSRAEHVLETAAASMRITGPVLGISPDQPLHIITYHNYQDMIGALPFRSQATSQQLITQGMAFDEERVLMVHSGDRSVTGTTAHEFVHLLVGDALGRAYSRVPAWLNEGLAEYGSRHSGPREIVNFTVERAIASGDLRPIWHLGTYSGTPDEIIYAYAHGESVVTFLIQEYGEAKMAELMQAIARTFDIDKALEQVYGFDQHGLDSAWRLEIGLEPLPAPNQNRLQLPGQREPQPTINPVLMPTFPPRESAAPQAAAPEPAAQPTPAPRPELAAEPTLAPSDSAVLAAPSATPEPMAAAVESPTAVPAQSEPEPPPAASGGDNAAPGNTAGGCSLAASPAGGGGELLTALLLVAPLGLALGRRWRPGNRS